MFIPRSRGANKREPVLKEELFWMNDKTTAGLDFYWMGIWTYAEKKEKQPTSNNRKTEISHFFVTVGCHANLISCEYGKVGNY